MATAKQRVNAYNPSTGKRERGFLENGKIRFANGNTYSESELKKHEIIYH